MTVNKDEIRRLDAEKVALWLRGWEDEIPFADVKKAIASGELDARPDTEEETIRQRDRDLDCMRDIAVKWERKSDELAKQNAQQAEEIERLKRRPLNSDDQFVIDAERGRLIAPSTGLEWHIVPQELDVTVEEFFDDYGAPTWVTQMQAEIERLRQENAYHEERMKQNHAQAVRNGSLCDELREALQQSEEARKAAERDKTALCECLAWYEDAWAGSERVKGEWVKYTDIDKGERARTLLAKLDRKDTQGEGGQ